MKSASGKRFWTAESGNVAVVFGLTLPILACCMGAAVDISGIYASKRNLQHSVDIAALAAGREYSNNQQDSHLSKIAEGYFFENAGADARANTDFSYDGIFNEDGSTVLQVSAARRHPTIFGDLLSFVTAGELDWRAFPLAARSQIVVQNQSIELVMVLDNSGSMTGRPKSGGGKRKIDTIKEAAIGLTDQFLKGAASSTLKLPVQFGVVPFAAAVNIGPDNHDAKWMDTKGRSSIHNEYLDWANWKTSRGVNLAERSPTGDYWQEISSKTPLTRFFVYENAHHKNELGPWLGCVESRPNGLAITDAEPNYANPDTLFVPSFGPDEYDGNKGDNDYLEDDGSRSMRAEAAMSVQSKVAKYFDGSNLQRGKHPGPNRGCRSTPITPLTDNQTTINAAINAMDADGETNIPEGIAWGWRLLSAREPFTQGRANDAKDNLKVLVLMTDGDNNYGSDENDYNESGYGTFGYASTYDAYGNHSWGRIFDDTSTTSKRANRSSFVSAMNEKVAAICQNIKDDGRKATGEDGIVIFTIAFDLNNGSSVKKLMEQCASYGITDPTKKLYYDAKSSSDLMAAFDSITEQVSSLRIAK
ncbi:pilus assembly protein TadG-related protein [Aurantimonas sp. NFXS3]|uniref:TadE/TadG family type IV pilus assembly protein n=1 Tax=Aurantimonas sp. NFXS3 TaxID=2818434 RepID=UPI003BA110E2